MTTMQTVLKAQANATLKNYGKQLTKREQLLAYYAELEKLQKTTKEL